MNGHVAGAFRSRALPPRALVLGGGVLALTLSYWTTGISDPHDRILGPVLTLALIALGAVLLVIAALRPSPWTSPERPSVGYRAGSLALLSMLLLSAVVGAALAMLALTSGMRAAGFYNSDAASFNHYNAELVLRGNNPYTADASFWDALRQFPDVGATPLRLGRYANSQTGPSLQQIEHDVRAELAHPEQRGPEYSSASLHSYPALAFLVFVPGVWAGLPTTMLTALIFVLAFLAAAAWEAPRRLWFMSGLLLLGNQLLVAGTLRGSFEAIALLPALLAWRTLDRRWLSPILLGLGCAVKQVVWPLVPFYVIIIWRRHGPLAALRRTLIVAMAFLAPNLPFLLAAPRAWAASMLLPVSLPMFPSGVGIIALVTANVLPLWPSGVYTALELIAMIAQLLWFARAKQMPRPEIALIIGLLPLLFAWRSLGAYFLAIPTLAVYACLPLLAADTAASGAPIDTGRAVCARPVSKLAINTSVHQTP